MADCDYIDRFNHYTTSEQVLHNTNVKGKVFMITGSSNGIGFEAARWLCFHGAKVILCGSSARSVADAEIRLRSIQSDAQIYHISINLCCLKDVQRAASEISKNFKKLDGLILNAGVGFSFNGAQVTEDGFESIFQVNFLSQFYLTLLLTDLLEKGSRVVIVSSNFYKRSYLTRDIVSAEYFKNTSYKDTLASYGTSKLLNILHARELSRKLADKGVLVFACHPGIAQTNIYSGWVSKITFFVLSWRGTKTMSQAAANLLYAATSTDLKNYSGYYIANCCLNKPTTAAAVDDKLARKIWDIGIDMLKKAGCSLP